MSPSPTDNGRTRDGWCTPRWLAELIGRVDLDPCGNGRSHIDADRNLRQSQGDNGLLDLAVPGSYRRWVTMHGEFVDGVMPARAVVYCNPPYSRGNVAHWVRHYRHTRFIYLLRWDPSTRWFDDIMGCTDLVWFSYRRINFEAPAGIRSGSNPFPHALFLRDPREDLLQRLAPHGRFLLVDASYRDGYRWLHDDQRNQPGTNGSGEGAEGTGGTGGGGTGARRDDWDPAKQPLPSTPCDTVLVERRTGITSRARAAGNWAAADVLGAVLPGAAGEALGGGVDAAVPPEAGQP